jgi:hypothetical protein
MLRQSLKVRCWHETDLPPRQCCNRRIRSRHFCHRHRSDRQRLRGESGAAGRQCDRFHHHGVDDRRQVSKLFCAKLPSNDAELRPWLRISEEGICRLIPPYRRKKISDRPVRRPWGKSGPGSDEPRGLKMDPNATLRNRWRPHRMASRRCRIARLRLAPATDLIRCQ